MRRSLIFGCLLLLAPIVLDCAVASRLGGQDIERRPIRFESGFPKAVRYEGSLWAVRATGTFDLDPEWKFKELRFEMGYRNGDMFRLAHSSTSGEDTGNPGTFAAAFANVPPPNKDEIFHMKVILVASQQGKPDREWFAACPILSRSD
jgi:hypothetical protein